MNDPPDEPDHRPLSPDRASGPGHTPEAPLPHRLLAAQPPGTLLITDYPGCFLWPPPAACRTPSGCAAQGLHTTRCSDRCASTAWLASQPSGNFTVTPSCTGSVDGWSSRRSVTPARQMTMQA